MKRITDSRRHAPVFCSETVKGGNGFGVAQDYGNLATLGAQGGLPLRSGFGFRLGHGLADDEGESFAGLRLRVEIGTALVPKDGAEHGAVAARQLGRLGGGHGLALLDMQVVGGGDDGVGEVVGHFVLRVGPIPTVETSYPVTSDKSTPNMTVRREAA